MRVKAKLHHFFLENAIKNKRKPKLPPVAELAENLSNYLKVIKRRTQVVYYKSHMRAVAMILFKIDRYLQESKNFKGIPKETIERCHQVRNYIAHEINDDSSSTATFCEISPHEVFEVAKEVEAELQKKSYVLPLRRESLRS